MNVNPYYVSLVQVLGKGSFGKVMLVRKIDDSTDRYMVLNYMPGGELFFWLKKDRRFSEPRARLYAAEMTMALETMHAANIIYRYVYLRPRSICICMR